MEDIERKILTIVFHISEGKQRNAYYEELLRFTGRDPSRLDPVLKGLSDQGWINWEEDKSVAIKRKFVLGQY